MNSETMGNAYSLPVSQLLSLGEPADDNQRDYKLLGLAPENVPDLIRMAVEEELNSAPMETVAVWAPVHAWRALGQLGAAEAVMPLLSLLKRISEHDDDWVQTDVPKTLAQIGLAALEPSAIYMADAANDEWARISAASVLGLIGERHPDLRAECVTKLAAQLEKFSEQSESVNTFLVLPLCDLRAVEVMPLIERAFAAGCVDESVVGDVEDVQIEFGLKAKREHPARPNRWAQYGKDLNELSELRQILDQEIGGWRRAGDGFDDGALPEPCIAPIKIGRNEPCPCGSGKKYKKCCGA